jgi:hypothetical protein
MGKLLNIDAETNANIIDDGADPSLKITNSNGMALEVNKMEVDAGILVASATVVGMELNGASVASGAVLKFSGDALVSCTSILFVTGGVAGTKAIRIVQADGTFAWIPVLPDAAITGAAV